jgi:hypothetical protein
MKARPPVPEYGNGRPCALRCAGQAAAVSDAARGDGGLYFPFRNQFRKILIGAVVGSFCICREKAGGQFAAGCMVFDTVAARALSRTWFVRAVTAFLIGGNFTFHFELLCGLHFMSEDHIETHHRNGNPSTGSGQAIATTFSPIWHSYTVITRRLF